MPNDQRQAQILRFVESKESTTVLELSAKLKVSPSTIRRDLEEMEKKGLLIRTHGGAMGSGATGPVGIRFFLDTANIEEIREASSWGVVDGITTNPTLVAKEGREFRELVDEICALVDGPISVEAVSQIVQEIVPEAQGLARIHPNVVVKIPQTIEGLKAIKMLSNKGIKTNATLTFSPSQALLAAKAGATYVSPFIGRLDDINHIGMDLVWDIITIFENYNYRTQVIVASVRNPLHVVDAALAGAHVVTMPFRVLEQLVRHPLTDVGVERFLADWQKIPRS
jgi:transaldolase